MKIVKKYTFSSKIERKESFDDARLIDALNNFSNCHPLEIEKCKWPSGRNENVFFLAVVSKRRNRLTFSELFANISGDAPLKTK